jgi:uncharacterized protein YerC
MKVKKDSLSDFERIETLDTLYTAAGVVKGRAAMKTFLRDLLTESERIMLGRRIVIARRLLKGDSTSDISAEMHVGLDTIYRIERWLYGQFGGYEHAIAGLEKEHEGRRRKAAAKVPFSFANLKKKYPLHFLFFKN